MANDGHLKILHDETDVWNRWREENAHVMPDLNSADVGGANFGNADLNGANLRLAELGGADFSYATWTDGSKCAQGAIGGCNGG